MDTISPRNVTLENVTTYFVRQMNRPKLFLNLKIPHPSLCFRTSFFRRFEELEESVKFLTKTEAEGDNWIKKRLDVMAIDWALEGLSQRTINRLRERERRKLQTEKDYESGKIFAPFEYNRKAQK